MAGTGHALSSLGALRARPDRFMVPVLLFALFVLLAVFNQHFLSLGNLLNVSQQIAILAIVSVGMTVVIVGGGFDLSVGSTLALSGSVAALVMVSHGVAAGILAGLGTGIAVGLVNGLVISCFNVSPFIATLGMLVVARGLALGFTGGSAVFGLPESFSWLGEGRILGVPVPALVTVVVVICGYVLLKRTTFGVRVHAVGGNREAARLSGILVTRATVAAYAICGFTAGLAGVVLAARLRAGESTAGVGLELFAIAAVVLGGASLRGGEGSVPRAMLGVLFIGILQNGLNLMNVPYYWQQVVIGTVFIAAACLGMLRKGSK